MENIWTIGSSNVDMIMQMERLPNPGETVLGGVFRQVFGGKGANSAVASARAGGAVTFVSCLGDDVIASQMVELYAGEGMDVSRISREDDVSSGTAFIQIDKAGMNCISVAPGANFRLTADRIDALEDGLRAADRIVLQCEIPMETNARVIELGAKYGIPVQLNLAPAKEIPRELLACVDTLVVNESEAQFLLKEAGLEPVPDRDLAAALMCLGSRMVVVTLGADGAVVATRDGVEHIPAFRVDVVDTTAAGDTFCGALAVALCEGRTLPEAMRFASAASALSVGKLGAIPSIPQREDIDAFLSRS